jgi:hypothetical protein
MPENFLLVTDTLALPRLFSPSPNAGKRFIEFFTANIRNSNTHKAYARAAVKFAAWCENLGRACMKKVASAMRCLATITWMNICMPILIVRS